MTPTRHFDQSSKLKNVLYEIRGNTLVEAARLEAEGHRILKLNTCLLYTSDAADE